VAHAARAPQLLGFDI